MVNEKRNGPADSARGQPVAGARLALAVLLILISYTSISWAAPVGTTWYQPAAIAILITVGVVVAMYIIVHLLHLENLKALVHDEMVQIIATAVLMGLLLTSLGALDDMGLKAGCGITQVKSCSAGANEVIANMTYTRLDNACKNNDLTHTETLGSATRTCSDFVCRSQEARWQANPDARTNAKEPYVQCASPAPMAPLTSWATEFNEMQQKMLAFHISNTLEYNQKLAYAGASSGFCAMFGAGYSVAGCSAYNSLRGPVSQLSGALGFAVMDLQAERLLLDLNTQGITTGLLLALGILLRALHITRKAGGALIALALSLYFVFPATLILGQAMAGEFIHAHPNFGVPASLPADHLTNTCDPFDPQEGPMLERVDELIRPAGALHDADRGWVKSDGTPMDPHDAPDLLYSNPSVVDVLLFEIVGRALLITALALTATLGAARGLGALMGTELEIGAIARLS